MTNEGLLTLRELSEPKASVRLVVMFGRLWEAMGGVEDSRGFEDETVSLVTDEWLDCSGAVLDIEASVGFAALFGLGGAEDSRGFATFSEMLSGTSIGDDGDDDVVPASLGSVQAQFSSSEGV